MQDAHLCAGRRCRLPWQQCRPAAAAAPPVRHRCADVRVDLPQVDDPRRHAPEQRPRRKQRAGNAGGALCVPIARLRERLTLD